MLRNYLTAQVDKSLQSTVETITNVPLTEVQERLQSVSGLLPTQYLVVYISSDQSVPIARPYGLQTKDIPTNRSLTLTKAEITALNGQPFNARSSDGNSRWRAISVLLSNGASLVVAQPMTSVDTTLIQYRVIFLTFGGLVLLSSMIMSWWLAESIFSPLRRAERAAARIAAGDYSERLPGENSNTEIGRLNRSLNAMTHNIDHAFADRARTIEQTRRFVADASHELRTPLVSVRGYAELYRMGALEKPEDVTQAMSRIEHEAIRMGHLVEDLLELARLDEAKALAFTPVDLIQVSQNVAMDTRARAHDRVIGVIVEPQLPPQAGSAAKPAPPTTTAPTRTSRWLPHRTRTGQTPQGPQALESAPTTPVQPKLPTTVLVLGQEEKLQQVVTNLVGNALRYTPSDSPIELAVGKSATTGFVEIRDHGPGIPPQIREKIFQRFWRADTSRTRETGGSGLGLSIVAAIMQAHHGSVTVGDTPGGGATFRIEIPLTDGAESAQTPSTQPQLA